MGLFSYFGTMLDVYIIMIYVLSWSKIVNKISHSDIINKDCT